MLLAIEALELVITEGVATVIIASSDQDFIHLVVRLRERGVTVIGIGEAKTPVMFRAVCHEFKQVGGEPHQEKPTVQADKLAGVSELDLKIREIIAAGSTRRCHHLSHIKHDACQRRSKARPFGGVKVCHLRWMDMRLDFS